MLSVIILIALCLVGGTIAYIAMNNGLFSGAPDTVTVESVELARQTDGGTVFTVTLKNAGNKAVKALIVTLGGEAPYSFSDVSEESPLEPSKSISAVITPTGEYIVGNTYIVTIEAVFVDGSSYVTTTSVTCRGSGGERPKLAVSVRPPSAVVEPGEETSATITVTGDSSLTVQLSASNLPPGASVSFDPQSGSPPLASTMTVATSSTTPAGTYKITVTGTSNGLTSRATFTLRVASEGAPLGEEETVVFSASGLGSDASGTVLTVDGESYGRDQLPVSFTWEVGSQHSFAWTSHVDAGAGKRYAWTGASGLSTAGSGTIIVPQGGGSISASYKTQYKLTTNTNPSGAGSISLSPQSPDGYYDEGASVTATASANTGYTFSKWQLDGSDYSTGNVATVTMDGPHTLTALFTGATYTLTIYAYKDGAAVQGVTVEVDGATRETGSDGKVDFVVSYGQHMVRVAPKDLGAGTRYVFAQWSDGSTSNPRTISVTAQTSLTAYLKRQYLLTVTVDPEGAGSVSANPSSDDWFYDEGAPVTLTANPNTGYAFNRWIGSGTGSYSGTANPATVTMNAPITQTANFAPAFSLSVNPTRTTVLPGGSDWTTLTVSNMGSNPLTVTLSASGLPQGASASFSTNPLTVPPRSQASCTLTVTTSADTPAGSYAITITGSAGTLERTTVYSLIVIEQGGVLVLLQGQDFCFGFTACQSAQWVDQNTGQTYTFPFNYYLDYTTSDSPTGDIQQNNAVVYVWGHDFIFAFASESFVYRPSATEVVGAETSNNVFTTLLPQTSEAVGSPTGPAQQNNAIAYVWGADFVFGWGEQVYTYYYSSSSEQTGSETSANINPSYVPSSEAVGSPTGQAQQNNAIVYIWGADFVYGWGEQTYTYRSSSNEQTGPETSTNIVPLLNAPASEVVGSPTGPAQQNNAIVYIWGADFAYGWGEQTYTYRSSSSEQTGPETSANINPTLNAPSSEAVGSPTGSAQQNNAIVYVWGADFIFGWGDSLFVYRSSNSEVVGAETSNNISPNLSLPPSDAIQTEG